MKKIIAFFAITCIMILISPLVAADSVIDGAYGLQYGSPVTWSVLSPEQQYYTARQGAQEKGLNWAISYDDYMNNKGGSRDFIRENGYVFTWNNGAYNIWSNQNYNGNGFLGVTDSTNYDYVVSHGIINDGSINFNSYNNAVNNAVSGGKKQDFYNGGAVGTVGSEYDFGNGYVIKTYTGFFIANYAYDAYYDVYLNGNKVVDHAVLFRMFVEGFDESAVKSNQFYITHDDNDYYLRFKGFWYNNEYTGYARITNYVTYVPSGMSENEITPSILNPINPTIPYEPEDGSDQSAVNEALQQELHDSNNWLEKIYNEEVSIHSTLKSFLSPLSGLLGCGRNIESICNAILSKLDNLTVRIKNSDGTDIDFGDLELGDINIDFDVVYNVTGITKITSANDLTNNLSSYKQTLDNKLGMDNARQTANNFSRALFGTDIINQNGTVNTAANPSFSANKPTLYVYYNNIGYDLFAYLNFTQDNLTAFKDVVSFFLLLGTFLSIFRYIPSLVGNITGLEVRHEMVEHAEMQNDYIQEYNAYHDTPFNSKSPNPFKGRWI